MRNPLKRYYFASGESTYKKFDASIDQWFWKNPQDVVTQILDAWNEKYGNSVTINYFGRI